MLPLKQRHEEFHNYNFPEETDLAKIWTNHRLHEYVAKRAFGIDVEDLSRKITLIHMGEDMSGASISAKYVPSFSVFLILL